MAKVGTRLISAEGSKTIQIKRSKMHPQAENLEQQPETTPENPQTIDQVKVSKIKFNDKVSSCCCWNFTKQKLEKLGLNVEILGIKIKVEENPNSQSASDKYQINFLYSQQYQEMTQKLHKEFQTAQAKALNSAAENQKGANKKSKKSDSNNQSMVDGKPFIAADSKPADNSAKPVSYDESHEYFLHLVALVTVFCIEMNSRIN